MRMGISNTAAKYISFAKRKELWGMSAKEVSALKPGPPQGSCIPTRKLPLWAVVPMGVSYAMLAVGALIVFHMTVDCNRASWFNTLYATGSVLLLMFHGALLAGAAETGKPLLWVTPAIALPGWFLNFCLGLSRLTHQLTERPEHWAMSSLVLFECLLVVFLLQSLATLVGLVYIRHASQIAEIGTPWYKRVPPYAFMTERTPRSAPPTPPDGADASSSVH